MTFRSTVTVRSDDLDVNGHVRGPAYLAYADHARWECVRAAGIDMAELTARGLGPVNLETTLRFHRELRLGDEITVVSAFRYGSGKTSRVQQELLVRGQLMAEVSSVSGLLDLRTRRLVEDPGRHWREIAAEPEPLGLR